MSDKDASTYPPANRATGNEGRRLQIRWAREVASVPQDPAVTTHDFVNFTGGAPDDSWTDADFLIVENAFDVFWTAVKSRWPNITKLDQYRWYRFGPNVVKPQPAVRIVERDVAGTGGVSSACPPQVAVSVTERSGVRHRWGRFYLPAPYVSGQVSQSGRLEPVFIDALADAAQAFYESCFTGDINPVVYSPTVRTAYGVEAIQVDDLYDVIRSRRWKQPGIRDKRPVGP